MKKKLLLALSVMVVLVCLFTISVSAADFSSGFADDVTTFDSAPDWANVDDTDSTAVIMKADGTYVRVPAYYVFKANNNQRFEANGSNFDFGWISEKLGEDVGLANLVAIEIPYGTTGISGQLSTSAFTALEEIVVPTTVTSFPQKLLRGNAIVKRLFVKQTIDADGNVVGVKAISDYFADQNSALEVFALELDYVTFIGSNAFNSSKVKELTFEGPITNISGSAFSNCTELETVVINNTGEIITIGNKAFAYCPILTSVTLNGLSLSDYLFENVNGLTGGLTVIATNVGALGQMPFKNATNLESVEISGPLTSFGSSTFLGCHNLKTVEAENTSTTPASCSGSFSELKALESVTLHNIQIGYRMFYKVSTLESLTLTGAYTEIGQEAFVGTPITSFTVPAGFTLIDDRAFQNCTTLTSITFAGPAGENAVIDQAAFEGCTNLTTLEIPEGVTTLGNCVCKKSGLTSLSLPTTLTTLTGGEHFSNTNITSVVGLENTKLTSISDQMFRGLKNWTPEVVRLPDTVTSIGVYGMADCGAKVFILGTGVQTIAKEAFVNCPNVVEFYIPDTITSIGTSAFKNNRGNILFFVTSDNADYIETIKSGTGVSNTVAYGDYTADSDAYATGKYVITGVNKCVAFYEGEHSWKGTEEVVLDSYFAPISIGDTCQTCSMSQVKTTIESLFVSKGVSAKVFGEGIALVQGYEINTGAIEAYRAYVADFNFGIMAYANSGMTEVAPKPGDDKVVDISFDNMANDYIEVKLTGIPSEYQDIPLIFCVYATEGDKFYYLDNGVMSESIVGSSYNDIVE